MSSENTKKPSEYYPRRSDAPSEVQRLDDLHEGVKQHLGGALSCAPLEGTNPKIILDMGAGTGAWAIQAATQFPDAEVLAIDISPLPPRDYPPNVKHQIVDLTNPLPFEPETFDIVHSRFVLVHLPDFENILSRVVRLIKPGGWLILHEVENFIYNDGERDPKVAAALDTFLKVRRSKGIDPLVGAALNGLLKASGAFSEVNVKKVSLPLTGKDCEADPLARAMKTSLQRTFRGMAQNTQVFKLGTEDVVLSGEDVMRIHDEMDDPSLKLHFNIYFNWCRKL